MVVASGSIPSLRSERRPPCWAQAGSNMDLARDMAEHESPPCQRTGNTSRNSHFQPVPSWARVELGAEVGPRRAKLTQVDPNLSPSYAHVGLTATLAQLGPAVGTLRGQNMWEALKNTEHVRFRMNRPNLGPSWSTKESREGPREQRHKAEKARARLKNSCRTGITNTTARDKNHIARNLKAQSQNLEGTRATFSNS